RCLTIGEANLRWTQDGLICRAWRRPPPSAGMDGAGGDGPQRLSRGASGRWGSQSWIQTSMLVVPPPCAMIYLVRLTLVTHEGSARGSMGGQTLGCPSHHSTADASTYSRRGRTSETATQRRRRTRRHPPCGTGRAHGVCASGQLT